MKKPVKPTPVKRPVQQWNEKTTFSIELLPGETISDILKKVESYRPHFPTLKDIEIDMESAKIEMEQDYDNCSVRVEFEGMVYHELSDAEYQKKLNLWEIKEMSYEQKMKEYNQQVKEAELRLALEREVERKRVEQEELKLLKELQNKYLTPHTKA